MRRIDAAGALPLPDMVPRKRERCSAASTIAIVAVELLLAFVDHSLRGEALAALLAA
jgi:hypothetical protein